jgi:regulator of sigma E protease
MVENLLANIQDIIVFIIFLGILVFVHEWGHFITAKKLGVQVDEFSLGFGPTLFKKFYGGTNYLIKLWPLGGYVKMAGDERSQCTGQANEFFSKSPEDRALIVFNGPLVNFILAYLCFSFVYVMGYPELSTKIGEVINDKPAQAAGLLMGDEVLAVDGRDVYGWSEMKNAISKSESAEIVLTVNRNDEVIDIAVESSIENRRNIFGKYEDTRNIGISPYFPEIGYIDPKGPAASVGLKEDDQITKINGIAVGGWFEIQKAIEEATENTMNITYLRNGQELSVVVEPKVIEVKGKDGEIEKVRQIGIGPRQQIDYYRFGFIESLGKAGQKFVSLTQMTLKALASMVTGTMSAKENVAGPVGIFNIVNEFAEKGIADFLLILGIISLNLAIFNLLPILPLDGGHLFLLAIERVRGKALPENIDEWVTKVGLTLILLLALFVFYVDFERIGLFEKIQKIFS